MGTPWYRYCLWATISSELCRSKNQFSTAKCMYDALFEGHDLTKGGGFVHQKKSGLDMDEFHHVLRTLGYSTFQETGTIEYDKDTVIRFIQKAGVMAGIRKYHEHLFLDDVLVSVPLFTVEGNYYKWKHKAMQEYFAQYICADAKAHQETILMNMYRSAHLALYIHVLDLCYKTFRATIVHQVLQKMVAHY